MKKAFIITGPSSSGNHLMTEILVKSGCTGTVSPKQTFEEDLKVGKDLLVWRGSMPTAHLGMWDISEYLQKLWAKNYFVKVIVMNRDMFSCASSIVSKYEIDDIPSAYKEINNAYKHIYRNLDFFEHIVSVSYEALIFEKKNTLKWLSKELEIELNTDIDIRDENKKWIK